MGTTLISIIGSLIMFLLGLLLYLVKATRTDVENLEIHFFDALDKAKSQLIEKVSRPDCLREMAEIKTDLKEAIKDIRTLEKEKR